MVTLVIHDGNVFKGFQCRLVCCLSMAVVVVLIQLIFTEAAASVAFMVATPLVCLMFGLSHHNMWMCRVVQHMHVWVTG